MSKISNRIEDTHKNITFSFEEKPNESKIIVQIGDKPVEVFKREKGYYSSYLPYGTYPSVLELIKDMINFVPGFSK